MKHTNTLHAAAYSLGVDVDILAQVLPALREHSEAKAKARASDSPADKLEYVRAIYILSHKKPDILDGGSDCSCRD